MWHHNKKNPLITTPAKAPAQPNAANATAKANPQTSTIKMGSPEIRIGLDGATTRSGMIGNDMLKPSSPKKTTMNTTGFKSMVKIPKPKKAKSPSLIKKTKTTIK